MRKVRWQARLISTTSISIADPRARRSGQSTRPNQDSKATGKYTWASRGGHSRGVLGVAGDVRGDSGRTRSAGVGGATGCSGCSRAVAAGVIACGSALTGIWTGNVVGPPLGIRSNRRGQVIFLWRIRTPGARPPRDNSCNSPRPTPEHLSSTPNRYGINIPIR